MGNSERLRIAALVILVVASLAVSVGPAVAQPEDFQVTVGQELQGAPAASMRFLPDDLSVAQGDTITFTVGPTHTATLLPPGQVREEWIKQFATDLDDPWSFPTSDPDDGTNALKLNNNAVLPNDQDCLDGTPCSFDGSGVLNSGFVDPAAGVPAAFSVTFDVAAPATVYALCLVHNQMKMRISVVDEADRSVEADVQAEVDAQIAEDTDWAQATHRRMRNARTSHENAQGQKVWDVYAGVENKGVALFGFYPKKLPIRRGQLVRFRFDSLLFENHTATFPLSRGLQEPFVMPSCDPDGDGTGGTDTPAAPPPDPPCDPITQLEVDLNPKIVAERGNGVFKSGVGDYENSGERGAAFGAVESPPYQGDDPWDLRFRTTTSRRGVGYLCGIHPFMRGKVVVRR